ncbi:unnamed protein product, partial [Rotaria magnacalcarata]
MADTISFAANEQCSQKGKKREPIFFYDDAS